MAGEINGTDVIITDGTGAIVGQMEATLTFNGAPIDISNKSYGDWVTLLDGALATKQFQFSGPMVYNDDTQFRKVRADSLEGNLGAYTITYISDAATDEAFSGSFMPTGLSDDLAFGGPVKTTITFVSSGEVTHTPAA